MAHTLQELLEKKDISPKVLALIQQELLDDLAHVKTGYRLTPEKIMISTDRKKVWLEKTPLEEESKVITEDPTLIVKEYGNILLNVVEASPIPSKKLERIARNCISGELGSINEVQLAIEKRISNTLYTPILIAIAILLAILAYLNKCSQL